MKTHISIPQRIPALLAGLSLSIGSAQAAMTAYDGFGHPATSNLAPYAAPSNGGASQSNTLGSILHDKPLATLVTNTGLGFPGKWIEPLPTGDIGSFTTRFFRYSSNASWVLNYPGLLSNNSAGALMYGSDFSYGQINRASRLLTTPFTGSSTGTHYMSFLMRKNTTNTGYIGFEMLSGGGDNSNRTLQFGGSTDTSAATGNWGMRLNNTSPVDVAAVGTSVQSDVPVVTDQTVLVVMKLTLSAAPASDSVTLWVNPADLGAEGNSGAGVTVSGIDFAADRIAMAGYTYAGHWCFFDEFRLGSAWGDVLPGPSVETASPVGVASQYAFGAVGQAFNYKLFASNRPTSYSVTGTLPDGLVLNSSTGVISGSPMTIGVSSLSFTASNSFGTSVSVPFSVEVVETLNRRELIEGALTANGNTSPTLSSYPYNSGFATSFAYDGDTNTNHSADAIYNNRLVVDLGAGNERFLTGFRFFPRATAEARAFGGEVQTSMDGVNFTKLGTIDFSPVAGTWNTIPITSTARGRYFRYFHPGRTDIAEIEFRAYSAIAAPPAMDAGLAATLTIDDFSRVALTATNEPSAWTNVSSNSGNNRLPAGLILNTGTGEISGAATELGVFTPSFVATNDDGTSDPEVVTIMVIPSALIVYEGFDYTEEALAYEPDPINSPGNYVAVNGGTGWSGPWQTWSQEPLMAPGLAKDDLLVAGKRVMQGTNGNQRDFPVQASTGVYWFNVLMTVLDEDNSVPGDLAYGLNIQNAAGISLLSIGYNYDQYKIGGNNIPTVNMPNTVLPDGSVKMFTVRLDMSNNTMHAWVDATPGNIAPSDASAINPSGTAFTPFAFSRIRFSGFGPAGDKAMDEIRIGKTFEQVAPAGVAGTSLQAFRAANGLAADGSQDLLTPAGDGVSNLIKFAFNMIGSGPGQADSLNIPNVTSFNGTAGLPVVGREIGTGKLQITYLRRKAASNPGCTYSVQFSNDLGSIDPWAVNSLATEVSTSIDSIFEQVVVTDNSMSARRFARVQVIGN